MGIGTTGRREIVACLATRYSESPELLSTFGPPEEEEALTRAIQHVLAMPEGEQAAYVTERIRSLVAGEEFVELGDIHPAWLLEVLSRESPMVTGIILRFLPSRQVRYIIEHLPKRIKNRLPQLIDSFAVPAPILGIVRRRFEAQFVSFSEPTDSDSFSVAHVFFFKSHDLEALFRDLGIQELAMALKGVDRRSLHLLFNRLSIEEARALQQRIRSLNDIPASLLQDAKYSVLEMNLTEANPEYLLMELGLSAFARSLHRSETDLFPLIKQKLPPYLAHILRRYIDQHLHSGLSAVVARRREVVFQRVTALAGSGTISGSLVHHLTSRGETQEYSISLTDRTDRSGAASVGTDASIQSDGWQPDQGVV